MFLFMNEITYRKNHTVCCVRRKQIKRKKRRRKSPSPSSCLASSCNGSDSNELNGGAAVPTATYNALLSNRIPNIR